MFCFPLPTFFRLALKKVVREPSWTVALSCVLIVGLTVWIMVPSIGLSLETALNEYSDKAGTYVAVSPSGFGTLGGFPASQFLGASLIEDIDELEGVERVHPFTVNDTSFVMQYPEGGGEDSRDVNVYMNSAVLGNGGYPPELIELLAGILPSAENRGMLEITGGSFSSVGETFNAEVAGVKINTTLVGSAATIPFVDIIVLWDKAFLLGVLGPDSYQATFGHHRANYLIVKAESVEHVDTVAAGIREILEDLPRYQVRYDRFALSHMENLKTQVQPLYYSIGVMSLASTLGMILISSYVNLRKRSWEVGLLLSQGWRWRSVVTLYSFYFLVVAVVSGLVAIVLAGFISNLLSFSYEVSRGDILVRMRLSELHLISSIPMAVLIGLTSVYVLLRRFRKLGIENMLSEY